MTGKELSKYMINSCEKSLTMGEFREITKDIPDDAKLINFTPIVKKIHEDAKHGVSFDDICNYPFRYLQTTDMSQIIYMKKDNAVVCTNFCTDLSRFLNKEKDPEFLFQRFIRN